jgi:uncharacterized protein (DUF58 family)
VLTGRAWAILGGGVVLWLASRIVGSPDLHMIALALIVLVPLAALLVRATRHDLTATRRLSSRRVFPGTRLEVHLEVHNRGRRRTSLLLLEDRIPPSLGRPARAALADVPPGGRRDVTYRISARGRGRFPIGPLAVWVGDPFDLIRHRIEFPDRHDLIVYPEVEDLGAMPLAAPTGGAGESSTRQLFRAGDEFYTMRQYETGDDLRRIHWPSVARTGKLMIRQDEAVRRAQASILLDTRASALGDHSDAFERAVSTAASIGSHYLRAGFALRLGTPDRAPRILDRDQFLELLALIRPSRSGQITPALRQLRQSSAPGTALVVVTHVPIPEEVAALSRLGSGYATSLAALIHAEEPDRLAIRPRWEAERRAEAAAASLSRGGWEVLLLRPSSKLRDAWQLRASRPTRRIAASS